MNGFKRGTPIFGLITGCVFVLLGVLFLTIGFWKTILIAVLFAAGYFIGAVNNKSDVLKDTVNKIVPNKTEKTINIRDEIQKIAKEKENEE